ncbi:transglycosylase SLT domain-containing protein [Acetobacter sp. AN02]|uniref:transglycosylase SLT domain-containing protein n=1 Tax=Acetobacter sp. AN02 TaxID=2894186 RepID=UPI00243456AF|nr:transglycosylase SLT domain-containing protein [Acetobacter sp. AN02]MDG6094948.1 transglycosylase SLT domain-containing protein [Acetobacter sp. AN02]
MQRLLSLTALLIPGLWTTTARAQFVPAVSARGVCTEAALIAEHSHHIPEQFLVAVGRVESGRHLPGGQVIPWPWTVNAEGRGYVYESKADAIAAVKAFQAQGIRSIDVGCFQVNLMHHAGAFVSLDSAFDPVTNANYAASFLSDLFSKTGSWPHAAAAYHSFTPGIGEAYQWKVLESWATPAGLSSASSPAQMAARNEARREASKVAIGNTLRQHVSATPSFAIAGSSRPFTGGLGNFTTPPPSRPTISAGTNRSLAFYRANPVRVAQVSSLLPGRF